MGSGEGMTGEEGLVLGEGKVADEPIARASNPAVAEFALRSFEVVLPGEPLYINGHPYQVEVDADRLVSAVNVVAEPSDYAAISPRRLVIGLHSTASILERDGILPHEAERPADVPPLLSLYEDERGLSELYIMLPSEVTGTGIANAVTHQANEDLLRALSQNLIASRKLRSSPRVATLVLAAIMGENAGFILSDTGLQMLAKGSVGAVAGAMAGFAGLLLRDKIRGGWDRAPQWAIEQARDYRRVHWLLSQAQQNDPIITLEPVQSPDDPIEQ